MHISFSIQNHIIENDHRVSIRFIVARTQHTHCSDVIGFSTILHGLFSYQSQWKLYVVRCCQHRLDELRYTMRYFPMNGKRNTEQNSRERKKTKYMAMRVYECNQKHAHTHAETSRYKEMFGLCGSVILISISSGQCIA